jgi:hypothetical protein
MARKILLVASLSLSALVLLAAAYVIKESRSEEVAFMNEPRYELGEHRGAEVCGTCHEDVYAEWRTSSRHAVSTSAESVLDVMEKLEEHAILNFVLGGRDMCYACHGPEAPDEGVNCETCHGVAPSDVPIMETHQKKYIPGMARMQSADFCAKCHEIPGFVTPYSDWQQSEAAMQGLTCQGCHMGASDSGHAYHGFDSFVMNERLYDGDLSLNDILFDFPILELTIENHIKGHSVPAGGPTRILALELSFRDTEGVEVHGDMETFAKYHSLIPVLGFWPAKIIADTQLKSGEQRHLSFALPPELDGKIATVQLVLRFYEVHDEHEGKLEKAYYVSRPILEEEILNPDGPLTVSRLTSERATVPQFAP